MVWSNKPTDATAINIASDSLLSTKATAQSAAASWQYACKIHRLYPTDAHVAYCGGSLMALSAITAALLRYPARTTSAMFRRPLGQPSKLAPWRFPNSGSRRLKTFPLTGGKAGPFCLPTGITGRSFSRYHAARMPTRTSPRSEEGTGARIWVWRIESEVAHQQAQAG